MKYQTDPRKKRRGPEINTGGVQQNVARIMAKVEAGEKVVPLRKGEVVSEKTKNRTRIKLYKTGVCSGCLRPLILTTKGRTFHAAGIVTKTETCPYGVMAYREEPDYNSHAMKIIIGGSVKTVSFFSFNHEEPDPALYEHDVPDWVFFSDDGEFI